MARLWRYLTAVPADHAPARSCAMRNASTACAYVGAGPSEPCPGGRLGGGLIVATAPSRRVIAENAYGWSIADDPDNLGQLWHRERLSQGMRYFLRLHLGVVPEQDETHG